MVFYNFKPEPSGKMAILSTVSTVRESILVELGSIEHIIYSSIFVCRASIDDGFNFNLKYDEEFDLIFGGADETFKKLNYILSKNKPRVIFILDTNKNKESTLIIDELRERLKIYSDIKIISLENCYKPNNFSLTIESTLLELVKELSKKTNRTDKPSYNILASCRDMYKFKDDIKEIERILENSLDIDANCILTSDTSIESIEEITGAWINLVIREEGLKTARYLEENYAIPYIYYRPYGVEATITWINTISEELDLEVNEDYILWELNRIKEETSSIEDDFKSNLREIFASKKISLGGHKDIVKGLSEFAIREMGLDRGIIWHNNRSNIEDDIPYFREEEFLNQHKDFRGHILMASGEVVEARCLDKKYQISNPSSNLIRHKDDKPLVGFAGALHLMKTWSDSID